MANDKKAQKIDEIDTVIGPGTKLEGKIEATGIVRVDGSFEGDIITQGDIIIGEKGSVQGQIKAKNMIVAGTSLAKIKCQGKLEIRSTGKVVGDVIINDIIIEEKAIFEGQCLMRSKEEKAPTKEAVNE